MPRSAILLAPAFLGLAVGGACQGTKKADIDFQNHILPAITINQNCRSKKNIINDGPGKKVPVQPVAFRLLTVDNEGDCTMSFTWNYGVDGREVTEPPGQPRVVGPVIPGRHWEVWPNEKKEIALYFNYFSMIRVDLECEESDAKDPKCKGSVEISWVDVVFK